LQYKYFHEHVRENVATALPHLVLAAHAASNPGEWEKGQPQQLPEQTKVLAGRALDILIECMQGDDAKEVVARCCESVQKLAEAMGPSALESHMPSIAACLLSLLQEKSICQTPCEDEEDEEEDADHDHVLMDAVADCVGSLAKAWGALFNPFFQPMFPAILKFAKGMRPGTDRSMAIGAIAEVLDELDEAAPEYIEPMVPFVMKGLADADENVRVVLLLSVGL
jgi:hypothetical protein